ncbi:MAG: hypothetical protein QXF87_08360, partial [Thermofilaceae archaeon]
FRATPGDRGLRNQGEAHKPQDPPGAPGASRSLYIGSKIYTASPNRVKVFNVDSFKQVAAEGLLRGRDLEERVRDRSLPRLCRDAEVPVLLLKGRDVDGWGHPPLKVVDVERVFIYSRLQS